MPMCDRQVQDLDRVESLELVIPPGETHFKNRGGGSG